MVSTKGVLNEAGKTRLGGRRESLLPAPLGSKTVFRVLPVFSGEHFVGFAPKALPARVKGLGAWDS